MSEQALFLWVPAVQGSAAPSNYEVQGTLVPVEPVDTIILEPAFDKHGDHIGSMGGGQFCRMEAHLPSGTYHLVKVEDDDG